MSPVLVSILAQVAAAQARVAGMQAANQHWVALGQSPAYDEQHFKAEADALEHLAIAARSQE